MPQRYAAYTLDGELLGYCGRDGCITHPEPDVPKNMRTNVIKMDDARIPRKGLRRSILTVRKMLDPSASEVPNKRTTVEKTWRLIARKELGLYASGPVRRRG